MTVNAMPTHTVPEKGSEQPICSGEGHILPVITQAQSPGGMSLPVSNKQLSEGIAFKKIGT